MKLQIENRVYNKLTKLPNSKHPWNVAEGVVLEGNIIAEIKYWKDSMSLDGTPFLYAETPSGRYLRTSPIKEVKPIENGYEIVTANSIYILEK